MGKGVFMVMAAVMGLSLLPQAFAGGGGGRSGITEECGEAVCEVRIIGLTFAPDVLQVKTGTTVAWTSMDKVPHTVTSGNPTSGEQSALFDSGLKSPIMAGEKWEHRFNAAGTYDYYCQLHPRMAAQVVVSGEPVPELSSLVLMIMAAGAFPAAVGVTQFRKKHIA